MPEIPQKAVTAGGAAIERELLSGKDYTMSQDSDEALARAAMEAAAVILGEHVAEAILRHASKHGPRPGSSHYLAWHRHFSTAARVAAGAFLTKDDERRLTLEALARGDFIVCDIPEVPGAGTN